ncbi:sensor histidine kinase [Owenweeksia hongkongensis]|uniref:sensor histidine kinase n=1 Tax=Owenweeksia hongkongensis TaxID=253245 RepID=UPI003A9293C5
MQNLVTLVINPLAYRKNTLILLLCLLALAGVQSYGMFRYYGIPMGTGSIDAVISWFFVGALVFFTTNTLSYYHPSRGKGLYVVMLPLVLAYLWLKLTDVLILAIINDADYTLFFDSSAFYRFSVCYLILAGTTLFSFIWYQLGEKEGEQRRKEETERMAKEAELFKLRQQLQPHFLFNSLNSINSLIGSRPQEARTMVQQLSDFLRGTLKREDQRFITLGEELDYLKLYLDIEQVRFGHRLKVEIDCEEEYLSWKLPPLILQPIMENAIKFGLYGTTENLVITFACKAEDNILLLTINNPYDSDMQPPKGTGFGLRSVKRRLYLLYTRTDLLEMSGDDGQFIVRLKVPMVNV